MKKVNTVTGPVDVDKLGFTLCHEHLYLGDWNNRIAFPDWYDYQDGMKMIVGVLEDAKKNGVDTIVDCTTFNMGRDINILKEASEKTGVNIIAASGCMMDVSNWAQRIPVENLTKLIIKELTECCQGADIKCGVIKCGIENALDDVTKKMLQACAKASKETGAPIMTHCRPAGKEFGLKQLEIFKDEGVDLSKVVIGHYRNGDSIDYAKKVFDLGANIAIDQMNFNGHQFEHNMTVIPELIEMGYSKQLFLSHDAVIVYNHSPWKDFDHRTYINYSPTSYSYMKRVIVPELMKRNVKEEDINQIFKLNIKRLYTNEK